MATEDDGTTKAAETESELSRNSRPSTKKNRDSSVSLNPLTEHDEQIVAKNGHHESIPADKSDEAGSRAECSSNHDPTPKPHQPITSGATAPNEISSDPPSIHRPRTTDNPDKYSVSEWSHQQTLQKDLPEPKTDGEEEDDAWQEMPAYATHTIYDDWGKILAKEEAELDALDFAYGDTGGAGRGYTKVQLDEDAKSATSIDDNTAYLFKPGQTAHTLDEDDQGRDMLSQMQATKDLLTEGQRIAYVGIVRLSMIKMVKTVESYERTRDTKKQIDTTVEALNMWSQRTMVLIYRHMDIEPDEQIMIEQLALHGVVAADLTPTLMLNARVKNPVSTGPDLKPAATSSSDDAIKSTESNEPSLDTRAESTDRSELFYSCQSPTASEKDKFEDQDDTVRQPEDLAGKESIDIDLRWTVLCDLFLVLVSDSSYDARSRALLELVGEALSVSWLDICRFEKRVTDALEMQEAAAQENWNEEEHVEKRKKSGRNKRLIYMGLATVGGGLVIGLSAGLLAPVIGAGLAAGFTTIGVAGTSTFLGGAGAAALITSTGILTGGTVAIRASSRRMGSVKTFEYRPLHNNKRVNLVITLAGWMTGKVDDVRLPFSTIDPIMGDIYSVLWEPEMLQSMGQTINILATEALTQGLQQLLSSTILTALMGALQLPIILTKLSYLIDNPWSVSMSRADQAGLILADSLIERNLGVRPVTLVGFSIGARVIFCCLRELARRGALGLVHNVYLFGSPVVANRAEYIKTRTVVSGRYVNGYATNDWILGYLFRATAGGIMRVAGLAPVEISGIENINVTEFVPGHMSYRGAMPKLMREVGWMVQSLEFTEIEDPDPDNHEKRQRELINEIEEARKDLHKKPSTRGLRALFSRPSKKAAEKKSWEQYDERSIVKPGDGPTKEGPEADSVLFDIDSIRAEIVELASQGVEVRELETTLPAMKINAAVPARSASEQRSPVKKSDEPHSQSYHGGMRVSSPLRGSHPRDLDEYVASLPASGAPVESPVAVHENAWADEGDLGGHGQGGISMTFE